MCKKCGKSKSNCTCKKGATKLMGHLQNAGMKSNLTTGKQPMNNKQWKDRLLKDSGHKATQNLTFK